MINNSKTINKLKDLDIKGILQILLNNIFLILFFSLLGLITGYFIVNQENDERKFELYFAIPETDYTSRDQLILINEYIGKIVSLEREKLYVSFFKAQNPSMPVIIPIVGQSASSVRIGPETIMNILLEYTKNPDLYKKTNDMYNQKVKNDFTDPNQINDLSLSSIPSKFSLSEDISGRPQVSVRIFFADNYSDYVVENYSKIFLENIVYFLKMTFQNKYKKIINEYEQQREMVYDFVMFGLDSYSDNTDVLNNLNNKENERIQLRKDNIKELAKKFNYVPKNLGEIIALYGDPLDQPSPIPEVNKANIITLFKEMYPKFNSKDKYFNVIEDTGILDGSYNYFYQSSSLNSTYKSRYKSRLILQENNSIVGFTILGFIFGTLLAFLRFYYFKVKK